MRWFKCRKAWEVIYDHLVPTMVKVKCYLYCYMSGYTQVKIEKGIGCYYDFQVPSKLKGTFYYNVVCLAIHYDIENV